MIFIVDIALQYRWNSVVEHSVSVWVVIAFIVVVVCVMVCIFVLGCVRSS